MKWILRKSNEEVAQEHAFSFILHFFFDPGKSRQIAIQAIFCKYRNLLYGTQTQWYAYEHKYKYIWRIESVTGMENKIKAQIFSLPFVLNVSRKFIFNSPSFPLCLVGSFFSSALSVLVYLKPMFFPNSLWY